MLTHGLLCILCVMAFQVLLEVAHLRGFVPAPLLRTRERFLASVGSQVHLQRPRNRWNKSPRNQHTCQFTSFTTTLVSLCLATTHGVSLQIPAAKAPILSHATHASKPHHSPRGGPCRYRSVGWRGWAGAGGGRQLQLQHGQAQLKKTDAHHLLPSCSLYSFNDRRHVHHPLPVLLASELHRHFTRLYQYPPTHRHLTRLYQ
jgi:hypothetical protein